MEGIWQFEKSCYKFRVWLAEASLITELTGELAPSSSIDGCGSSTMSKYPQEFVV
jgi:hypothetical protein